MAKSPKKSRRGGRRSPKKSKKGVQKIISKEVSEQPISHAPELDAAEDVPGLSPKAASPKAASPKKPDSVPSAKEMLTHFFASLNPDVLANAWSFAQLPEQEFLFGKLAAQLAATGHFGDEVETNLSVVWTADEAWTRSLLAGEVKPPEPEAPEEPEPVMEVEAEETLKEAEAAVEPEAAEVAAPVAESVEPPVAEEPPAFEQPPMMEVTDKENAMNIIEDAVKMPLDKQLGEPMHISAVEGLPPKDVNFNAETVANLVNVQPNDVQPMEFA